MDDAPKLITISCQNHHDVLVNGLWNFVNQKCGLDYKLYWGGHSILAHKLVLSVFLSPDKLADHQSVLPRRQGTPELHVSHVDQSIPTFEPEMVLNQVNRNDTEHIDSKTNIDRYEESDCNLDVLLEFLYKGKVMVCESQMDKLLQLAKDLDFGMLESALEATMKTKTRNSACRRQRKGNPNKLVQYADVTGVSKECNASTKRKCQLAKGRKKAPTSKMSDEEDDNALFEPDKIEFRLTAGSDEDDDQMDQTLQEKKISRRVRTVASTGKQCKPKQKPAVCMKEGDALTTSKIDRRTIWRQRQPLLKCEHCCYESRHKSRFEIHRAKHDQTVVVFRCETCSRAFISEDQLETHKTQAHGSGSKIGIHQCSHCEYKTRDKGWFQVHLAKHDPTVVVFRCETCGNPYSSQESLDRHMVTQHGDVAKTYKCGRCTFETEIKTKYYQHLYSTHKVNGYGEPMKERYKCPECKYTCSFRSGLRVHAKSHTQDKAFKCSECDYASSHQGAIYRHVRTAHLHIKNHVCHICGHRSATRAHLDRHLQSHTQEKPFKCDVCGQCYADRRYLRDHLRSHVSNEKTYICHICGHASSRQEYLNSHLKAVHHAPSEAKRGRQSAGSKLVVATSTEASNTIEPTIVPVSAESLPVAVMREAGLPISLQAPGLLGEQSMISLQHMSYHNFVCS